MIHEIIKSKKLYTKKYAQALKLNAQFYTIIFKYDSNAIKMQTAVFETGHTFRRLSLEYTAEAA